MLKAAQAHPIRPFAGILSIVDDAGYSESVTWTFTLETPRKEIEDLPPGYAYVTIPVTGAFEETNSTPGRNYPVANDKFAVGGLYPKRSRVCQAGNSVPAALTRPKGKYCWLPFAGGSAPSSGAGLAPSQSTAILSEAIGGESRSDAPEGTSSYKVEEKEYVTFVRDFMNPVMLTLNTSSSASAAKCQLFGTLYEYIVKSTSTLPACDDQQLVDRY